MRLGTKHKILDAIEVLLLYSIVACILLRQIANFIYKDLAVPSMIIVLIILPILIVVWRKGSQLSDLKYFKEFKDEFK